MELGLSAAVKAAISCARREEEILYNGFKDLGLEGLLTAPRTQSMELQQWSWVVRAVEDLIQAIMMVDEAGFHGPYSLVLIPERYNLLYRRYPQGNLIEINHLKTMITEGVVKTPALEAGRVLIAHGPSAHISLGQDLMTGFVSPAGADYEFTVSESLALKVLQPEAICVLK